jgi:hypothetical protein
MHGKNARMHAAKNLHQHIHPATEIMSLFWQTRSCKLISRTKNFCPNTSYSAAVWSELSIYNWALYSDSLLWKWTTWRANFLIVGAIFQYMAHLRSRELLRQTTRISSQDHSWASASRKLTPASAFRHQIFQSGTGLKKWCRTESAWSDTGSVPAPFVFVIPVPDWLDAPDSPAFRHLYTRTQTRTCTGTRTRTQTPPRTWTRTDGLDIDMDMQHGNRHVPWTRTSSKDTGMPECWWKV